MRARLSLLVLLLTGCAADVNPVQLGFPEGGPLGLACVDSTTGDPLLANARVVDGRVETSVVLDYLGFDGVPSCRPTQLLSWCTERGCPVARRDCVPLELEPPLPTDYEQILARSIRELQTVSPITDDAPDGVVLVRLVLTNQRCEELGPRSRYRPEDLLGCVYSCPVQLDEVQGTVELDLDALDRVCTEATLRQCADVGIVR